MKCKLVPLALLFSSTALALLAEDKPGLAPKLPVDAFASGTVVSGVALSRDGKTMVYTTGYDLDWAVAFRDWATGKANIYGTDSFPRTPVWINEERVVYGDGSSVNRDGSDRRIIDAMRRGVMGSPGNIFFARFTGKKKNSVLFTYFDYHLSGFYIPYYITHFPHVMIGDTMALIPGSSVGMELENPGNVARWFTDGLGNIRVGEQRAGVMTRVVVREEGLAGLAPLPGLDWAREKFSPLGLSGDGQTLYIRQLTPTGTWGVYAYDLKKRQIGDLLLSHNRYDIGEDGSLIMAPGSRQLLGIRYTADVPVTVWLDPDFKALQAAFDEAMPGKVNTITSMSDDLQHVILYSKSDRDAGTYYQFDRKTQEMKVLFATRPMLKPDLMGKTFPASFKARDGVVVHGYLTIPRGRDPKNLPIVIYPHDGPWQRDVGMFDDEVQFLANRGYAVMQINYRGSYGYGDAFARRDSQHIQKEAYNDVVDGTRWAVEKGIADPKHVAIMGEGFFSGYLALNGITQNPELYCCAISGDGVSDWLEQLAFVKKTNADSYDNVVAHFGDPVKAKDELIDMSPITHVQNIKGPVLLLYSAWSSISEDTSNALKSALKKAGKSYEILDQHNGDSFYRLKIRKELFTKIETFLATNMPTETGPALAAAAK